MIDTTPSLQCNGTRPADLFGWEDGTKGVWVLENPTQDQYDKLSTFPSTTNDAVYNGYLVCGFLKSSCPSFHQYELCKTTVEQATTHLRY